MNDAVYDAVSSVPRIVHTVWLGERIPPVMVRRCRARLHRLHGDGWTVRLWQDADVTPENFPLVHDAVREAQSPAQRVDLLRLEILYRHGGGWYVDADVYFVRSLERLYASAPAIQNGKIVLVDNDTHRSDRSHKRPGDVGVTVVCHENDADPHAVAMMSTAIIGSTPWNPTMAYAARESTRAPLNTPNINETTGPFLFGRCLRERHVGTIVVRLPSATFYPHLWDVSSEEIIRRVDSYGVDVEDAKENAHKEVTDANHDANHEIITVAAHLWLASWK